MRNLGSRLGALGCARLGWARLGIVVSSARTARGGGALNEVKMGLAGELEQPFVLLHGVFGYGECTPLWGAMPHYFPLTEIRRARPRRIIVAPHLGPHTSNHDRACEAFAQLFGTRVDYGEAHASNCGHSRYGEDFTGKALLPTWDAAHPVHLIGHSFGGNTGLTLLTLLANDFWRLGTSAAWVCSITAICSPLRGCTLPFTWGLDSEGRHGADGSSARRARAAALSSNRCASTAGGPTSKRSAAHADEAAHGTNGTQAASGGCCRVGQVPRLFSVGHLIHLTCFGVLKAQLAWPWLRGAYDFRFTQWEESVDAQATWGTGMMMRHPFWRASAGLDPPTF